LSDPQEEAAGFIPRSRLGALTDAVFAFAMTLLVIELPEGFHPKANREFLHALSGLSDTFTAYLITRCGTLLTLQMKELRAKRSTAISMIFEKSPSKSSQRCHDRGGTQLG
jgi:hypothetical protein